MGLRETCTARPPHAIVCDFRPENSSGNRDLGQLHMRRGVLS